MTKYIFGVKDSDGNHVFIKNNRLELAVLMSQAGYIMAGDDCERVRMFLEDIKGFYVERIAIPYSVASNALLDPKVMWDYMYFNRSVNATTPEDKQCTWQFLGRDSAILDSVQVALIDNESSRQVAGFDLDIDTLCAMMDAVNLKSSATIDFEVAEILINYLQETLGDRFDAETIFNREVLVRAK